MRLMMFAGAAALALALAGCATPAPSESPAATAAAPARPAASETVAANSGDLDRVVCKLNETTGSRLPASRVCHTQREWMQMSQDARQATEKMQSQAGVRSPG
jgi:invasion protein IalB